MGLRRVVQSDGRIRVWTYVEEEDRFLLWSSWRTVKLSTTRSLTGRTGSRRRQSDGRSDTIGRLQLNTEQPVNVYRAVVTSLLDATHAQVRIDFGFRIYQPWIAEYPEGARWCYPGAVRKVSIKSEKHHQWTARLIDPKDERRAPQLWHYEANLIRVIDGDTFDARVRFATGLEIEERFRLARVQALELGDPDYEADAMEAKEYVIDRFARNRGRMTILTTHRGKWRRWLAEVFLPDSETTLNTDIVAAGLALWMNGRRNPDALTHKRVDLRLSRPLYDSLSQRASLLRLKPNDLAHNVVRDYLEQPPVDE